MKLSKPKGANDLDTTPAEVQRSLRGAVGAVYLAALAMIACAATQWHAVQTLVQESGKSAADQREFNAGLIESLHELSERAGLLTSADLCPVRFRLRSPDGATLPAGDIQGLLDRRLRQTDDYELCASPLATRNGILDFGLLPPGRYRLSLENPDGMTLVHVFDVLPGVPIDRCVLCPLPADLGLTSARASVVLGSECAFPDGIVLLEVAPAECVCGDWTWHPPADWPVMRFAASTNGHPLTPDTATRWPQLAAAAAPAGSVVDELSTLVTVPYRYCEIREVHCFTPRVPSASPGELIELGSLVFVGVAASEGKSQPQRWVSSQAPPRFEASPSRLTCIELPCPQQCLRELERLARTETKGADPADG